LRDDKEGIAYPGLWGFFGGSIEAGETPEEGAKRELLEEISYCADEVFFLEQRNLFFSENAVSYAYSCELTLPLQSLILLEGTDFKLVDISEIIADKIYSYKLRSYFSLANSSYIQQVSLVALQNHLRVDYRPFNTLSP
jgi:8-oxo-dGTP diphosphatase